VRDEFTIAEKAAVAPETNTTTTAWKNVFTI
jgi:hypothetical protein